MRVILILIVIIVIMYYNTISEYIDYMNDKIKYIKKIMPHGLEHLL